MGFSVCGPHSSRCSWRDASKDECYDLTNTSGEIDREIGFHETPHPALPRRLENSQSFRKMSSEAG